MRDLALERVHVELQRFRELASKPTLGAFAVEALGEDAVLLKPGSRRALRSDRPIDLTLVGLTHGNEVAGIAILNDVLRLAASGALRTDLSLAFVLGNVPAYLAGKRFDGTDLNRAFGRSERTDHAQRRARFMESVFERSTFVVDYHQTQSRADRPFFISLFDAASFLTFSAIMPACEVVTYWGGAYSAEGMTTINYQIGKGGHGFGIELGTKGFDPYQIEYGVSLALKLVALLSTDGVVTRPPTASVSQANAVYTWSELVRSATGEFALVPGLGNMTAVEPGMRLGTVDTGELVARSEGRLLFPKYPAAGEKPAAGTEVCRILRRVDDDELQRRIAEGLVR